ncbi:hypothetical protein [Clostridium intestinale]|uniref:hypothetical protein n=1 Tax=Clostridium intestinale TaxID=36845 RepID=UPI002DD61D29|nr:hypothetical protein [Clostridium intestinale]WRY52599.1 hypothetical protein P8F83_05230 [Clostridium intestinale]
MKVDIFENEIKEEWFNGHIAELTKHGDLEVLEWYKPNSSIYYCRYVFDGSKLYISGDIGEAIFKFTEKASIENISTYGVNYFHSKLSAFEDNKYSFDKNVAIEALNREIKEAYENMDHDDIEVKSHADNPRNEAILNYIETLNELIEESQSCYTKDNWDYEVHLRYDDLTDYNPDISEWIFEVGDVIPHRVQGYLVGLKMAFEQLNRK